MKDTFFLADHWPLVLNTKLSVEIPGSSAVKDPPLKRFLWREASERDLHRYQLSLTEELDKREILAEAAVCNEPDTCDHKATIQEYYEHIRPHRFFYASRHPHL